MLFSVLVIPASYAKHFTPLGSQSTPFKAVDPKHSFSIPFRQYIGSHKAVEGGSSIGADYVANTLVGSVGIGSPPQTMSVLFDTGSELFWVRSAKCNEKECIGKASFDSSSSSTYVDLVDTPSRSKSIRYGDGTTVKCDINQDLLTLGTLELKNQDVCEAFDIQTTVESTDGIIGIGPPGSSQNDASEADVFKNLLNSTNTEAIITIWYNIDPKPKQGEAGEITFGALDDSKYQGNITYFDLSSDRSHWQLQVSSVNIQDNPVDLVGTRPLTALIDTGTTLALLPTKMVEALAANAGAEPVTGQGIYTLNCKNIDKMSPVTFSFSSSTNITLTGEQMVFKDPASGICILIFGDSSNSIGRPILGALFLRNFYTVFDYGNERIGLAPAKNKNGGIKSNMNLGLIGAIWLISAMI